MNLTDGDGFRMGVVAQQSGMGGSTGGVENYSGVRPVENLPKKERTYTENLAILKTNGFWCNNSAEGTLRRRYKGHEPIIVPGKFDITTNSVGVSSYLPSTSIIELATREELYRVCMENDIKVEEGPGCFSTSPEFRSMLEDARKTIMRLEELASK